jgi:signal transduction histidine kinase
VSHGPSLSTAADTPPPHAPTRLLAAGVLLAMVTVAAVGLYTFTEIRDLRNQQTEISERNRKDALQLLRIQNDLALLAVTMRDLADRVEPYPIEGYKPAFDRLRADLTAAIALERTMAPTVRTPAQQARLEQTGIEFWNGIEWMFGLARRGKESEALTFIRGTLIGQERSLEELVSQLLIENNRVQDEAAAANRAIYDRVAREILILVGGLLLIVAVGGTWISVANKRAFDAIRERSAQLRTLSWHTLRLQEDLQKSVSRELHDDFGQILTALGTLLGRVHRHLGHDEVAIAKLEEVRRIAQDTLERLRSQSQWLHPAALDDFGLERMIVKSAEQFERQTSIRTTVTTAGPIDKVRGEFAIHVYRILQEALSNISRHSAATAAHVRVSCHGTALALAVEDDGRGLPESSPQSPGGIGLVSMRERTELMGGHFRLRQSEHGGLAIEIDVPNATSPTPIPALT